MGTNACKFFLCVFFFSFSLSCLSHLTTAIECTKVLHTILWQHCSYALIILIFTQHLHFPLEKAFLFFFAQRAKKPVELHVAIKWWYIIAKQFNINSTTFKCSAHHLHSTTTAKKWTIILTIDMRHYGSSHAIINRYFELINVCEWKVGKMYI